MTTPTDHPDQASPNGDLPAPPAMSAEAMALLDTIEAAVAALRVQVAQLELRVEHLS